MPSTKQKLISSVSSLILFACVSSCARISILDAEWCGDLGEAGASCFHTLSDAGHDLNKEEWDDIRVGMICGDAEAFANWKEAILKLCNETKRCTFQEVQAIEEFGNAVESVQAKVRAQRVL